MSCQKFNNMTEITASTAGSVVVTNAGNNLAQVTPTVITLPIAGDINAFTKLVKACASPCQYADSLEYFQLGRYGTIEPVSGRASDAVGNQRPAWRVTPQRIWPVLMHGVSFLTTTTSGNFGSAQMAASSFITRAPTAAGGHARYRLLPWWRRRQRPDWRAALGFSGGSSASAWRIRPTAAAPVTLLSPIPSGGGAPVGGDYQGGEHERCSTTSRRLTPLPATASGPCGPGGTPTAAVPTALPNLNRQRERASIVICSLNADVYALMEMENTTPSATVTDLLGAVNTRCGGAHPFAFVNTGGTVGTDAIGSTSSTGPGSCRRSARR